MFQGMLAAGAPLGEYAWGGQNPGVLPTRLRRSSAVSVAVFTGFVFVVLVEGGVAFEVIRSPATGVLAWVLAAFLALGTIMNGISRSRKERFTWTPVAAVATVLTGLVAMAG